MAGCLLSWLLRGWERIAPAVSHRTPTLHSYRAPGVSRHCHGGPAPLWHRKVKNSIPGIFPFISAPQECAQHQWTCCLPKDVGVEAVGGGTKRRKPNPDLWWDPQRSCKQEKIFWGTARCETRALASFCPSPLSKLGTLLLQKPPEYLHFFTNTLKEMQIFLLECLLLKGNEQQAQSKTLLPPPRSRAAHGSEVSIHAYI